MNHRHADFQSAALPTELSGHPALTAAVPFWKPLGRVVRPGSERGYNILFGRVQHQMTLFRRNLAADGNDAKVEEIQKDQGNGRRASPHEGRVPTARLRRRPSTRRRQPGWRRNRIASDLGRRSGIVRSRRDNARARTAARIPHRAALRARVLRSKRFSCLRRASSQPSSQRSCTSYPSPTRRLTVS